MGDATPAPRGTRNHLLLTDELLLRGNLHPLRGRLADHLRRSGGQCLTLEDVELRFLDSGDSQEFVRLHVPTERVVFAHEYVDLASDPHLRVSVVSEARIPAVVMLDSVSLNGEVSRRQLQSDDPFILLRDPRMLTADEEATRRVAPLRGLPWILIGRRHVQVVIEDEAP